jgi:hypothetical protein
MRKRSGDAVAVVAGVVAVVAEVVWHLSHSCNNRN